MIEVLSHQRCFRSSPRYHHRFLQRQPASFERLFVESISAPIHERFRLTRGGDTTGLNFSFRCTAIVVEDRESRSDICCSIRTTLILDIGGDEARDLAWHTLLDTSARRKRLRAARAVRVCVLTTFWSAPRLDLNQNFRACRRQLTVKTPYDSPFCAQDASELYSGRSVI